MNGEYRGAFLRKEEAPQHPAEDLFDDELKNLVRYRDRTREPVDDQMEEAMEGETGFGLWERAKMPGLFLALVCFMGASAHLELMDPMIAVPGMCLCSALFGWNARWR